jgi:hypothetical protein
MATCLSRICQPGCEHIGVFLVPTVAVGQKLWQHGWKGGLLAKREFTIMLLPSVNVLCSWTETNQ